MNNKEISVNSVQTQEKIEIKTAPMKMYDVLFFNDDYTPMDFVSRLLIHIFGHTPEAADELMLTVHNSGSAVVGTFVYEIAEEKKELCLINAEKHGFPLKVEISESSSEA